MRGSIREKILTAPPYPGVYIFNGSTKTPLYIGKAMSLKTRLRSYLQPGGPKHERIRRNATGLEYIITNSEVEALTLEESLIKLNRPRYNVRLRDDKKYPYLKLTVQDPFPRLYITRNLKKDGSIIFGPYTNARSLRRTVRTVVKIFKLRSCRKKLPQTSKERACLNFAMHRCLAPCQKQISEKDYAKIVAEVIHFLNGRSDLLQKTVESKMFQAARIEDYE
ncbi:MAG TPA: excinuclease ABC subunit C, partial [bacterium (Candidatus Stahlbacteria)]|nr:excinuclease ABC subunit C [Candidatus Stahlbacteria bacterium]